MNANSVLTLCMCVPLYFVGCLTSKELLNVSSSATDLRSWNNFSPSRIIFFKLDWESTRYAILSIVENGDELNALGRDSHGFINSAPRQVFNLI